MMIIDKKNGIEVAPSSVYSPINLSSPTNTRDSDSDSVGSENDKLDYAPLLSPADKLKIARIFENLDLEKCWKLSTGTIVEQKMKELALACNYEQ